MAQMMPDASFGPIFVVATTFHLPPHPSSTHCHAVICSRGQWFGNLATWLLGIINDSSSNFSPTWRGVDTMLSSLWHRRRHAASWPSLIRFQQKMKKKNHPPVSEVVDPEKKLKFRNAQVHFKLRSNTFSQKRKKSWTHFPRDHGPCATMAI